ncbi:hypothetical protein RRG08_004311 [Elysia crispata]|uniref:Uncharacterized protein n=1 Tax=Elysia crispata TaxID=231223 RepID=A0AAE0YCH5_9GAST|nr:hypothetical protein RRG08_004311 [Elysia crispata]
MNPKFTSTYNLHMISLMFPGSSATSNRKQVTLTSNPLACRSDAIFVCPSGPSTAACQSQTGTLRVWVIPRLRYGTETRLNTLAYTRDAKVVLSNLALFPQPARRERTGCVRMKTWGFTVSVISRQDCCQTRVQTVGRRKAVLYPGILVSHPSVQPSGPREDVTLTDSDTLGGLTNPMFQPRLHQTNLTKNMLGGMTPIPCSNSNNFGKRS